MQRGTLDSQRRYKMKTYKYTDNSNTVAHVIDEDGVSRSSCLSSVLPAGVEILPADAPTQSERIASAILRIDIDTDAIYGAVLGNRAQEYTLAEADATAYKSAGYPGTVPASVQCWATAKSWTARQAADDILATASAWRLAQAAIRAQRLSSKEAVRATIDAAGVNTAMEGWAGFVAVIRGQLGI